MRREVGCNTTSQASDYLRVSVSKNRSADFNSHPGLPDTEISAATKSMEERWRWYRLNRRAAVFAAVLLLDRLVSPSSCSPLNSEGSALLRFRERIVEDPFGALSNWNVRGGDVDCCFWFGVECCEGKVVVLNLRDLCLHGTLGPELGELGYLKSIILRNNSFFGDIPNEIGELKDLELLDLGYNNFTGAFLSNSVNYMSLTTLLLDNNKFLGSISSQLDELKALSEFQADENQLTRNTFQAKEVAHHRKLLVAGIPNPFKAKVTENQQKGANSSIWQAISSLPSSYLSSSPSTSQISPSALPPDSPFLSPAPSYSSSPSPVDSPQSSPSASPSPVEAPTAYPSIVVFTPPKFIRAPISPHGSIPTQIANKHSKLIKHHKILIWTGILGGVSFILITAFVIFFFRSTKVATVKPWATGLSGQLQKAFVSGVPKLKRSELQAACEDFSNIIGSFSDGTIYKGTLSSGVEIAVTSSGVTSPKDWSKQLESQFRKKIHTLSKVNYKNFVNLIGYCQEEKPFTRMMVFEYAPNGTLFEHLHVTEAEHLDWGMRLRIAMGIAYCLEHMHQLKPPITHRNLQSSSVYLTEDYAAKISDFSFGNDFPEAKKGPESAELSEASSAHIKGNVYSFGVILLEMITGRVAHSVDTDSLADSVAKYQRGEQPLVEMVDPTLRSFQKDALEKLIRVIKDCVDSDPKQRPAMKEVTARLKEITAMGPDGVTPKLSPLWWAELEIMSAEAS